MTLKGSEAYRTDSKVYVAPIAVAISSQVAREILGFVVLMTVRRSFTSFSAVQDGILLACG